MHRRSESVALVASLVIIGAFAGGCRVLEWMGGITHARLEDARVKPYLDAANRSNRAELGFSPLPSRGDVRVEVPRTKTYYDVMLHIDGRRVSRTVGFLLRNGRPVWTDEQEIHYSGRTFDTDDGQVQEQLAVSYSTIKGPGMPLGGRVDYLGPDEALMKRFGGRQMSPAEAKRIWDRWPR